MTGNPEDEALQRILGDVDGMESNRMFGDQGNKGVSITISVVPNGAGDGDADDYPEGHDAAMCGGGCAYHKGGAIDKDLGAEPLPADKMMAAGGVVPEGNSIDKVGPMHSKGEDEGAPQDDESKLPPFLRKKKKPLQDA